MNPYQTMNLKSQVRRVSPRALRLLGRCFLFVASLISGSSIICCLLSIVICASPWVNERGLSVGGGARRVPGLEPLIVG